MGSPARNRLTSTAAFVALPPYSMRKVSICVMSGSSSFALAVAGAASNAALTVSAASTAPIHFLDLFIVFTSPFIVTRSLIDKRDSQRPSQINVPPDWCRVVPAHDSEAVGLLTPGARRHFGHARPPAVVAAGSIADPPLGNLPNSQDPFIGSTPCSHIGWSLVSLLTDSEIPCRGLGQFHSSGVSVRS